VEQSRSKYRLCPTSSMSTAYVSIRQHRQHASAYVSIRQHTSACVSIRQHASAYVSIRQHTSAYVSTRQYLFFFGLLILPVVTPVQVAVYIVRLLRQYLYCCTSKASKLSTCVPLRPLLARRSPVRMRSAAGEVLSHKHTHTHTRTHTHTHIHTCIHT
jgi:hypothetical protein